MPLDQKEIPDNKYFDILREIFQIDVDISDADWEFIKKNLKVVITPRNTVVFKPGEIENKARFIIDGVIKSTYHDEETYIDSFMTDNDFLTDTFSLFDELPSQYEFETVTDCIWIEVFDLKKLTDENHTIQKLFLRYVSRYLKKYFDYNKQLRKQTAKERYIQFCKVYPKVVKFAKVSDIASYFGVTVQSLSRIRNEIVSNGC